MGRHLLTGAVVSGVVVPAAVVLAEAALLVAVRPGVSGWAVAAYALCVVLVVAPGRRSPPAAFVAALLLATTTGGAYALLLWTSFRAGHDTVSRRDTVVLAGATAGTLVVWLTGWPADPRTAAPNIVSVLAVFVLLPLLVGRYLAKHGRLVATLDRHNRQLRRERELLAERERLRERLRIARDMHDSLGHRLGLVSIQAAALEVSSLPAEQRDAVRHLATTARDAMTELYELIGALRADDETAGRAPGITAIDALVAQVRAAGVAVTVYRHGAARALSPAAGQVAYRVVQEGLTNAARHAPGRPVAVRLEWELDALLLSVANPAPEPPTGPDPTAGPGTAEAGSAGPGAADGGGHGLAGLAERVRPLGGLLDHRRADGEFRLRAMLPVPPPTEDALADPSAVGPVRAVALGFVTAALMFVVLPLGMLLGVR